MSPVFWREQVQQGEAVFLMQITAQHPQITSLHTPPPPPPQARRRYSGNSPPSRPTLGTPGRRRLLRGDGAGLGAGGGERSVGTVAELRRRRSRPAEPRGRRARASTLCPRLLPSGKARPGTVSGWLWLRRSRHAAQHDTAVPAAAPQTKPPRKRR